MSGGEPSRLLETFGEIGSRGVDSPGDFGSGTKHGDSPGNGMAEDLSESGELDVTERSQDRDIVEYAKSGELLELFLLGHLLF